MSAIERQRACTAPDLTPEQFAEACRFQAGTAAPESWSQPVEGPGLCSCGRCGGHGTLRITTAGVESWVPCREAGGLAYLPNRDKWKS